MPIEEQDRAKDPEIDIVNPRQSISSESRETVPDFLRGLKQESPSKTRMLTPSEQAALRQHMKDVAAMTRVHLEESGIIERLRARTEATKD